MPHLDGFEVCAAVRRNSQVPILFLTALGGEEDMLRGYALGCDDYVTKPFSLAVLLAKTQALIRRSRGGHPEQLICGAITVDTGSQLCMANGQPVKLPPRTMPCCAACCATGERCSPGVSFWTRSGGWTSTGTTAPWMCASAAYGPPWAAPVRRSKLSTRPDTDWRRRDTMEKLRAYRLRRRIAVPLMLAFSVLWLGTMVLLTASTQDRLDITVQRIYKDARDDLEEQWSYYEANLENGLGAEAEHIMVDNLSSSSLALTDIAEGGMAFVTRDEENHVIQSQLAWGYGHEADVDMGQRWHLRFDNGLDDAGQLELAQWIMEHRLQHWSYTLYPADSWYAEDAAKDPDWDLSNCDGRYARITGIELPGYAIEVQKVEIVHPDGTTETMVETTTPGEPTITLDLHYVKISSVLLPGLTSYSGGELENSPVDMQLRLKNFREAQAIVSRELADEDRVVQTRGGEITGMSNGSSGTMRMVAGQCSTLTAAIEEEQFLYISTFLLTAAVVLLLSGHLSRKVTSPVEELSQQAARRTLQGGRPHHRAQHPGGFLQPGAGSACRAASPGAGIHPGCGA